ncbi:hypothetical protein HMPREF0063_12073 [Aeromicrobium marinum DSM 15272]|jgi:hypothetical protein|uniref:Peptidase, M23 family n=1 Tax=Aeromicrobium marinum DSM 15272 TaxID=585531 RepID=E2SCB1_9ACTN|nr:hypothetical protein [Aeromicrobium marinum]EFQ82864.1 hypothetical protein HMPREF0063_12073 [Aeromicrobium marinum DSM 15272]
MKRRSYVAFALTAAVGLSGCATDTDRNDPSADPAISTPSSDGNPTPGDAAMPSWPAPTDVAARVAAAGLDLGPMGTAEHYHPQLRIVVDGADVPVPPNIGVDPATGAMSALHTHEGDGTIHIEADSVGEVFTLGQFFTQWGVALTPQQIGGVRAKRGQQVQVTSSGTPVTGDPADLRLEPEQKIVLTMP